MTAAPPGVARAARRHALLAIAFCALVVALLGIGVLTHFGPQMDVDGAVSEAVYAGDDRTPFTNGLLEVLTAPGLSTVRVALFLPVLAFLLLRRRFGTALWVGIVVLTAGPLNGALKAFFGRVRPDFDQGGARYDSLSYPSGHATGIAVLVTVTLLLLWPLLARVARRICLALGVVVVVLVGLTRMWLGVHFLSDVVGGWACGVGWSLLVASLLGGLPGDRAALRRREKVSA